MSGETALAWIDGNAQRLTGWSDHVWNLAEVGLKETESAALLEDALRRAGFAVTAGVAGMPTAFVAEWSQGAGGRASEAAATRGRPGVTVSGRRPRPILGFLAEYDALPGLSQVVGSAQQPAQPGAPGHGCGHNLLGVGVVGAAMALKAEMEREGLTGTIVVYGCPAEETLLGKVLMAKAGLFDDLDAALTWHPGDLNSLWAHRSQAMNSARFRFRGVAAHAASNPDQGRSALDAVELMNIGANYLREHVPTETRIHYVVTNGGGAPNIVPPEAESWYYVRGTGRASVDAVYDRILDIAKGAALMTGTTYEVELLSACYDLLPNEVLGDLVLDSMRRVGPPAWTAEEIDLARRLTETFAPGQKESNLRGGGVPTAYDEKFLDDTICPPLSKGKTLAGSTDVGDVSWITPTVCSTAATGPLGMAFHSWQMTSASGSTIGHKGMLLTAKALALAAVELLRQPPILERAWEEFRGATKGEPYRCAMR